MRVTCVVVMGVSGAGKSTVGSELGEALHVPFLDADSLHSADAVHKLSTGVPLTDDDRWPWLRRVGAAAKERAAQSEQHMCIVACSALKRKYRDLLRATPDARVVFVYLRLAPAVLAERLAQRQGHFMKASMLQSQLDTLQEPHADEGGVCVVEITASMSRAAVVDAAEAQLRACLGASADADGASR
ncbi:hypothetical protein MBRA1_002648 [Malassezia brasiliensis]|uniref:Gluconokinase n=1 Tax=Malassezia brasiliensis TaxID=1821822 RepID=A0AAF0DVB2_9BASI|nr:hypothetical protein MBRA1_002648 [Malassezia brasiliensis]